MESTVNSFIAGKNVIGADHIGALKAAHILGNPDEDVLPAGLQITKLDLQKLFVKLTGSAPESKSTEG